MTALSILATVVAAIGVLGILIVALSTQGFAGRPPQGADAMGLAAVAFAGIIGYLLFLVAGWLVAGRGGFDWLAPSRPLAGLIVSGICVGLFLATAICFAHWSPNGWPAPVLFLGGTLAPLAFAALLIACAWTRPDVPSFAPRLAAAPLVIVALLGYIGGAAVWAISIRQNAEIAAKVAAEEEQKAAERAHYNSLPRHEQLRETFKTFSPTTDLWVVSTYLVGEPDDTVRAVVLERCRQVPDLDAEVVRTLGSEHAIYRVSAMEFVQLDGGNREAWRPGLERAADLLIEQVRAGATIGGGQTQDDGPRASPLRQVELLTSILPRWPDTAALRSRLRAALAAAAASPSRDRAIELLDAMK